MRLGVLALALIAHGCGPTHTPTKEPAVVAASARDVSIVEGTPIDLGDGLVVDVKNVGYMHFEGSKNMSHGTLVLTKGGKTIEVPLGRDHSDNDPKPHEALGWLFTLVHANPYQQPSSVMVKIEPAATLTR